MKFIEKIKLIVLAALICAPLYAANADFCATVYPDFDANCNVVNDAGLDGICLEKAINTCLRIKVRELSGSCPKSSPQETGSLIEYSNYLEDNLGLCEGNLKKARKRIKKLRRLSK